MEEKIVIDCSKDFSLEEPKNKGYEVKKLDLQSKETNLFNPSKALLELAEENPAKFKEVVNELEKTIEKVYSEPFEEMILDETHNEIGGNLTSSFSYPKNDQ